MVMFFSLFVRTVCLKADASKTSHNNVSQQHVLRNHGSNLPEGFREIFHFSIFFDRTDVRF